MPRITAQDLPPQAHPEDAHAPGLNNSTSSTRISGFSPSPQDLHDAFHSPTPDSPVGKDPVQDNRPALPRGRLFEKRGAPEAFLMQHLGKGASGPSSQQRLQGSQGAIAAQQQQVRGANPPAQGGRLIAQQQAPAQAQSPAAGPAQNAPAAPQPPATGMENQAQQHPYKINEADENAEFVLTDKATKLPFRKGVKFGEHARSIMNEELAYSPTAMKLLKMACSLSGKNVIIKKIPSGEAYNQIGPDGTITVFVNPDTLRPGTLSHEIAHSIQNWTLIQGMRGKTGIDGTQIKEAKEAGRKALNEIAPVMEKDDDLDDSKENEAMRASHIVKAEITAAEIRAQIDAMKKSDPDRYFTLIKNPAEVAKMFWEKQLEKEDAKHIDNKARIPKGTGYGLYDFEHVLKLLGHGVSWRHLTAMRVQRTKGW
ncbi:MAG: hypothetical protein WAW39_30455 [Prosthecobacter sp.]|uniref:hypothetical protein n=1 Tax=Prosthecobacter sp. TaxID=1965333 RepID=UPI003BB154BE